MVLILRDNFIKGTLVYFYEQKWVTLYKFDNKEGERKQETDIEILCLWAKYFPICLSLIHHNFRDINSNKGDIKK